MAGDAEDGDLGRVDDRRERRAADAAQARDRERRTLKLIRFQLAVPGGCGQQRKLLGEFVNVLLVRIADDRDHQALVGIGRKSQVAVLLEDEILAVVRERGIDARELLQCGHAGLHDECERRQRDAPLLRRPFQLLPPGFELGDVGEVVLGHVRQVDPARLQARPGDLLDPRQRLQFDLAEFREIDLRRLRQRRRPRRRGLSREYRLDECLDVVVQDATLGTAAAHLCQVHAQFARELAHRRAGMGTRKTGFVDRRQYAGCSRPCAHRCGHRHRGRFLNRRCRRCGDVGFVRNRLVRPRRFGRRRRGIHRHRPDDVAAVDRVADRDGQRFDDATLRCRHVHRRLVRLQCDETVFTRNAVAGADEDLDDLDVAEIAQVRYDDIDTVRHRSLPPPTASPDPACPDRCRTFRSPVRQSSGRWHRRRRALSTR